MVEALTIAAIFVAPSVDFDFEMKGPEASAAK
jgi:hypothetical protein